MPNLCSVPSFIRGQWRSVECHGLLLPGQHLLIFPLSQTLAQCSKIAVAYFDVETGCIDHLVMLTGIEDWNGQSVLAFWRSWGYKVVSGSFNVRLRIPSELRAAVFLLILAHHHFLFSGVERLEVLPGTQVKCLPVTSTLLHLVTQERPFFLRTTSRELRKPSDVSLGSSPTLLLLFLPAWLSDPLSPRLPPPWHA